MPTILLTNDDGIQAEGLLAAADVLAKLGDLTIIAPEKEQSAVSHKITLHKPLRLKEHLLNSKHKAYSVSGTPADCVKIGINNLLKTKPDVLVSGINFGSNTGYNMIYSGTVAGAVEGMINHINSIAISLVYSDSYQLFDLAQTVLEKSVHAVLKNGLADDTFLNINIPPVSVSDCEGIEVCKLSKNRYIENFTERLDPSGNRYFWLGGKRLEIENDTDVDDIIIKQNKVAIAPIKFIFNHDVTINSIKSWNIKL